MGVGTNGIATAWSTASSYVTLAPLLPPAPGAPIINEMESTDTSLVVTWTAPLYHDIGIQYYKLQYKAYTDVTWRDTASTISGYESDATHAIQTITIRADVGQTLGSSDKFKLAFNYNGELNHGAYIFIRSLT